jgi:hypothetical protein
MLPTTWRGNSVVSGAIILRRLGNLQRLVVGQGDAHHTAPPPQQPDLPGGALGQVNDGGAAAHTVIHHHHDGLPRLVHGHANAGAQGNAAAGSGQSLLVEGLATARAPAVVLAAIPRGHADGLRGCRFRCDGREREKAAESASRDHKGPQ